MPTLLQTLRDYDSHLLTIIANRWDIDLSTEDARGIAAELSEAMIDTENAGHEWSRLDDKERGAMQMLLASKGYQMPEVQFSRLYGEIRQMGEDKRKRESPHLNPNGIAESLYYRGLIGSAFDQGKVGNQKFVFVPEDLATVLPVHQTGFDLTAEDDDFAVAEAAPLPPHEPILTHLTVEEPGYVQRADTLIVDDMTTLLAYLQMHRGLEDERQMLGNFLGPKSPARLRMLVALAMELGIVDDMLQPERAAAKKWLEAPRPDQVQALMSAWQRTYFFDELWHVPSLQPDDAGWEHDPTLLRDALRTMFELLPGKEWASIPAFIATIKDEEPDFQRPGGDYDSWYIRDTASGDYLNGYETWDIVEGATLFLAIIGPLHWLSIVDLGRGSSAESIMETDAFRMTAYGRAWAGIERFPQSPESTKPVVIEPDGKIMVSRLVSRYDRFQLARFSEWLEISDPFVYQLTSKSLNRAAEQGIETNHVEAFLKRASGSELPSPVINVLKRGVEVQTTERGSVMIQSLVVLQVDAPEQLQFLWERPEYRRFLGKRLGPTAVTVRTDQVQGLIEALEDQGIGVDAEV
ncbi:MAG: helicase-associated domain-containing protein [Chloroflexi bacterium]|nr:helicase-associated domain-containing protein [Chloroflexota bacterium]